jgi:5-methylthioadenosine/S-adenosylhomocysteine deaminase
MSRPEPGVTPQHEPSGNKLQPRLISAQWVLPQTPGSASGPRAGAATGAVADVLVDHTVVLQHDRIAALMPTAQALAAYPNAPHQALPPQHVLMPGLINMHGHMAMALMRGVADDRALMDWLQNAIWPLEGRHLAPEFVFDGTRLAALEALRGGTTTAVDMYFFPAEAIAAALDVGLRTQIGLTVLEFPTPYAKTVDEALARGAEAVAAYAQHPRVGFAVAPHAPYTVSDATFVRLGEWADELGVPMHCHVHETESEVADSLRLHGQRPLARLDGLGLLNPRFQAVHMVHLSADEIALLAERGVHVVHNPSSNMKLASGVCPAQALLQAGVNVCLGTDGAASNNRLDMFTEMRTAALLAKVGGQATAVSARQALNMATCDAARALGRGHDLGGIAPGMLADLVALDLGTPECQPVFDPISQIVYAAGRESVRQVWVAGREVLRDRVLLTTDSAAIVARAMAWGERLRA